MEAVTETFGIKLKFEPNRKVYELFHAKSSTSIPEWDSKTDTVVDPHSPILVGKDKIPTIIKRVDLSKVEPDSDDLSNGRSELKARERRIFIELDNLQEAHLLCGWYMEKNYFYIQIENLGVPVTKSGIPKSEWPEYVKDGILNLKNGFHLDFGTKDIDAKSFTFVHDPPAPPFAMAIMLRYSKQLSK
ncbi:hypothetical protein APHAL10511_001432 [Amanita phalloides]|nr:hypothetical protein APHAL10511_001432 [Amanita phalloides]